jgi:hypothetical protein
MAMWNVSWFGGEVEVKEDLAVDVVVEDGFRRRGDMDQSKGVRFLGPSAERKERVRS